MTKPTVVELPFDEAVKLEARQNMERDIALGLESKENIQKFEAAYLEEAALVLKTYGAGYIPESSSACLVRVKVKTN